MTPNEEVLIWQRLIQAENAIDGLNKRLSGSFPSLESHAHLSKLVAELDLRVKTLEEGRIRQIALNSDLINKTKEKPVEKKSFWDLFKEYARR